MTKEEIKNYVMEHKECCKKLAEEYRQRYNEDNTDKLALNMFYHNVISYNDFETILATIEDRNSMIMCFSKPPILSEKTVEVELNRIEKLEKENAELRKVAEFQQSSNMNRHFENEKLKEGLAVGSILNKGLNSMNKALEEERDKYRNMVFDKDEQLAKAKDHIKKLLDCLKQDTNDPQTNYYVVQYMTKAKRFLNSEVEE